MKNSCVEETIVVPDNGGNNFLAGILASACQQKGLDANAVLAMCGGRNGGFGNGFGIDAIIALIVVAAIFGNGNGGIFGGNNQNNGAGFTMVMDAIQRNGIDISQLASTLNCSIGQIQNAIQQVSTQICNVGNQVGMSSQQIINAVQQGNMSIVQQICNCCCDLKSILCNQTNTLQRDINSVENSVLRAASDLGYATRDQTCAIEKAVAASTEAILAGQRAAEMREMQRELAERDRRIGEQSVVINNFQQSQAFGQMLGQALAPVNAAVAGLVRDVNDIQCKLPETKVISCPDNYVRVNTGLNVPLQIAPACGYGAGYGWPYGVWPNGNNGGWG